MEIAKIPPLAVPKPLNWFSQKLARVITSWTAHGLHHTTKTAKVKKVLLRTSTLTLWRCASKVIAPFLFVLF